MGESNPYVAMAEKYIKGVGGLEDYIRYENLGEALSDRGPHMDAVEWMLHALTNPVNRADLDALVRQSELRRTTQAELRRVAPEQATP